MKTTHLMRALTSFITPAFVLVLGVVMASGQPAGAAPQPDRTGRQDLDGARFEPHYRQIQSQDQVQIYEAIMGTQAGAVTTGLLSSFSYLKDNRMAPRGFDKRAVPEDVAVHGDALDDPDFIAGEDRVRYAVDVAGAQGPFTVEAQLWYQSIAYRWAQNLRGYSAAEPQRFVSYYDQMGPASGLMPARATGVTSPAATGR